MITYILIGTNIALLIFILFYFKRTKSVRSEIDSLKKQLDLADEKLKEIDESKREFIDVVTHELNTPLATTSGFLSMILEFSEKEVNPTVLELAKKSFDATRKMSTVVADLIASSQTIGEGRAQAIQIEDLIEKAINDFSAVAKGRNLSLIFVPPKKIPLPLVATDPLSVKLILTNLIDNAIKFTKKGEVAIEAQEQKDHMLVKVSDTGVGIGKEDQKRIFDKFFQADSSRTREVGGTGVGLFIVKNLIEKQGGKVWVESGEGKGSKFNFTVPLA